MEITYEMKEEAYIRKRLQKARLQSVPFYLCRIFPIRKRKIVFCCIEGTTGYSCNPKYIAQELIRRNENYEMVWLVNDRTKKFPKEIRAVHNSLWKRAYHLATAHFWVDNSRKQLEVRKRRGQIYIQTWHATLGFKPTCLDRGAALPKIAYLVSRHDADLIDYMISNSKWYDEMVPAGLLYIGKMLHTGSPRCDVLVNDREELYIKIRRNYGLPEDAKILMYAPTFRGGSQETDRKIQAGGGFSDERRIVRALEERFGGKWYIFLRLHPQLVARGQDRDVETGTMVDVSRADDLYELLAGCDAFLTDYSSAAFDAAIMRIPVFLYVDDYADYEGERGRLLWDLDTLPFPFAVDEGGLEKQIRGFDDKAYQAGLDALLAETKMKEDGHASRRVVDFIRKRTEKRYGRRRHGSRCQG